VLAEADRAQFGFLQDTLNLTDGNLSRHRKLRKRPDTCGSRKVTRDVGPGPGSGSADPATGLGRRSVPARGVGGTVGFTHPRRTRSANGGYL